MDQFEDLNNNQTPPGCLAPCIGPLFYTFSHFYRYAFGRQFYYLCSAVLRTRWMVLESPTDSMVLLRLGIVTSWFSTTWLIILMERMTAMLYLFTLVGFAQGIGAKAPLTLRFQFPSTSTMATNFSSSTIVSRTGSTWLS